jgi:hypothetical protein
MKKHQLKLHPQDKVINSQHLLFENKRLGLKGTVTKVSDDICTVYYPDLKEEVGEYVKELELV